MRALSRWLDAQRRCALLIRRTSYASTEPQARRAASLCAANKELKLGVDQV